LRPTLADGLPFAPQLRLLHKALIGEITNDLHAVSAPVDKC